ncbi:hypothetical protein PAXINDRAFT_12068 [Paxillus involutus ATCC 200175]|uniref:Uncharacterized protein n=1 Tax=Paxillus involutus ATCC 200175 TaxID=664439 RepID=A0A0C9SYP3_PAXIN|nr:hypothetical protein PAXINDRAFT_12068 [Paxillus involutus ATCC 200175]
MPITHLTVLTGAQTYLKEAEKISLAAVEEDQEEEVECMENSLDLDHDLGQATTVAAAETSQEASTDDSGLHNLSMLSDNLKKASAGVILDTTIANYIGEFPIQHGSGERGSPY